MLDFKRYARHLALPEIGVTGQTLLGKSKVLCIGAGGLGSPLLLYLSAAGIGTLGIVENDQVDVSNLQRQVLFTNQDIGKDKGEVAKNRLQALNPDVKVDIFPYRLTRENALALLAPYDVIVDCTDNFSSRYLITDACFYLNKPHVYASILRFEGQCTVFNAAIGPCYRCLFQQAPPSELAPNCADSGVIGALPGMLGSIQALEVIKLILNIGTSLTGRLLVIDSLTMQFRQFAIAKNPDCILCSHKTPFSLLDVPHSYCSPAIINEISVQELSSLLQQNNNIFLLDVREPYEHKLCRLSENLIPLNELPKRINEIGPHKQIIVYCKMGSRSQKAVTLLKKHGYANVSSLKGGIIQWINEIDTTMKKY